MTQNTQTISYFWRRFGRGFLPIALVYATTVLPFLTQLSLTKKSETLHSYQKVVTDTPTSHIPKEQPKPAPIPEVPPTKALPSKRTFTLQAGKTLGALLEQAGVKAQERFFLFRALHKVVSLKELPEGQEFHVRYTTNTPDKKVDVLSFSTAFGQEIKATREQTGRFDVKRLTHPIKKYHLVVEGTVKESLYANAIKQGMDPVVLQRIIKVLGQRFDLQRDVRKGDRFKVVYEQELDEKTGATRAGNCLFIALTLSNKQHCLYHFQPKPNGPSAFFDSKGNALKSSFLRTPVDGARLSSRFGTRRHPILGYRKFHRGVDFAAPKGTPIMAAADGKIVRAGYHGSYGHFILIRHASGYDTAYAHLSRYHKASRAGKQVKQGQVIGYVGATGRATGAHLHFELRKHGRAINPSIIQSLPHRALSGEEKKAFLEYKQSITRKYDS